MPDPKPKASKAKASKPPTSPADPKPAEPAESSNDASPNAKEKQSKPEKPDDEAYKTNLAVAEKELEASKARLEKAKANLDVIPSNNKDSPQGQKIAALRQEQGEIRKKHQAHKDVRQKSMDVVKRLDEKLKAAINENKNARAKVPHKSVEDVEREIDRLQKQVDTGTMKLVDEKKALGDITGLHRIKKNFAVFSQQQKVIDDIKAQISEVKKAGDNPEVKAMNDRYNEIQKELDEMRKVTDDAFKNVNALRNERTAAYSDQQEKYNKIKEIKDAYYAAKRAYRDYEFEARKMRNQKQQAERAAYEAGKRREVAERKLEEASAPAYQEDIFTGENLIRHFDPSAADVKEAAGPSKFAAVASRTVDSSAVDGARVHNKTNEDDSYFVGGGGKKKKGKKPVATASSASEKFHLSIDVIEQLARIGIDPPVSHSHVPIVITKVRDKIDFWKGDQERKTKENIEKAKKEIEKLQAENSPSAPANMDVGAKDDHSKPAAANLGVNGKVSAAAELRQEQDAVADASAELEKAKIEDSAEA